MSAGSFLLNVAGAALGVNMNPNANRYTVSAEEQMYVF
jgi:hypothetical protein